MLQVISTIWDVMLVLLSGTRKVASAYDVAATGLISTVTNAVDEQLLKDFQEANRIRESIKLEPFKTLDEFKLHLASYAPLAQ